MQPSWRGLRDGTQPSPLTRASIHTGSDAAAHPGGAVRLVLRLAIGTVRAEGTPIADGVPDTLFRARAVFRSLNAFSNWFKIMPQCRIFRP